MRKIILFCSISLVVAILLSFTPTAAACTPVEPDYWYVGIVEVLDPELPEGISVTAEKFLYGDLDNYLQGFHVVNDSDQPIHLLYGRTLRALENQGLSQNGTTIPDDLLEAGIAMRAGGRDRRLVLLNRDFIGNAFDQLQLFSNPAFMDLNVRADAREGAVPDPQELKLGLEIEGKLYLVPITVSYEYNPDYDPYQYQNSVEDCVELGVAEAATLAAKSAESTTIQQANIEGMSDAIIVATEAVPEVVEENKNPVSTRAIVSGLILGLLFVGMLMVRIFGINKTVDFQEELDDE